MPIVTVQWPGISAERVPVWMVLVLGGMARSHRHAQQLVKRNYVLLNGAQVTLKTQVAVGAQFKIEVTQPNRYSVNTFMVVHREYHPGRNQRTTGPRVEHRRG